MNQQQSAKLHQSGSGTRKIFTAVGAGYVAVGGERFERPVVLTPEAVFFDWQPAGFDALEEAHFAYFLALRPEMLILGTGGKQRFVHPRLTRALTEARIGVECMDTAAACRTFNILALEERKVIAAILL